MAPELGLIAAAKVVGEVLQPGSLPHPVLVVGDKSTAVSV